MGPVEFDKKINNDGMAFMQKGVAVFNMSILDKNFEFDVEDEENEEDSKADKLEITY